MCETDSEIDDAIKELLVGSDSESLNTPKKLTLIALAPVCTPEQRHRVASALYSVLDDDHTSQGSKSLPVRQALCLASLATINVQLHACSGAHSSLQILQDHWSNLHRWMLHLKSDFVDQESVDLSFRILAKKCITDFLGACDDLYLGDLFDLIVSSPGIIATLVSLWRLETQDERFSVSDSAASQPIFHVSATLDSWMTVFSRREKWEWSEVLRPFADADALAATALDHLQQDVARTPINYDLIVWDIHLLTTLSINETIRDPLLRRHSMTMMVNVITSLVDQTTTDQHLLIAKCLSYGYWYIRAYVESLEGFPWIVQVLGAGILSAILSTEPWIEHLGGQDSQDWEPLFLLLDEIIPKYSVYIPALKLMNKQLAAIHASGSPGKLDKNGLLFKSWSIFEEVVQSRKAVYDSAVTYIETCENPNCNESGPPESFKICAACLHVQYCSKECQVYDWKQGDHRKLCHQIQFHRKHYLSLPLSKSSVRFLDRLIIHDLGLLRDRIQDAAKALEANPVVVELDYKEVPMEHDVGTIHTMQSIKTCSCDSDLAQEWNDLVKVAVKLESKNVLVRAFVPEGESERVKFQCLSLQQVLGDPAFSAENEPVSGLNEAFNKLYLRTERPGGDVGAAFPGEVIWSTREREVEGGNHN